MMNKTIVRTSTQKDHRNQNQNLEDGSDRQTKKESSRVHVSTCPSLQRDSETREYTKADNGLSHNLRLAPLRAPRARWSRVNCGGGSWCHKTHQCGSTAPGSARCSLKDGAKRHSNRAPGLVRASHSVQPVRRPGRPGRLSCACIRSPRRGYLCVRWCVAVSTAPWVPWAPCSKCDKPGPLSG